ncbi:hypothetical protein B0J13DRAFT_521570 [Dactylonectria estremocensis]|uniref:Uncharacterized protein n=1 Tax=Dactylonectria estremocensis TaxID=1079267 RepID=A0A9P9F7J7_9HYPO|nr:hypothetical protein B0J13DRAFT_521570 [Dactylonectria estremocensis]
MQARAPVLALRSATYLDKLLTRHSRLPPEDKLGLGLVENLSRISTPHLLFHFLFSTRTSTNKIPSPVATVLKLLAESPPCPSNLFAVPPQMAADVGPFMPSFLKRSALFSSSTSTPALKLPMVFQHAWSHTITQVRTAFQAKGNGIGSYCPWPREEFSYRGLCTHNPLIESPVGDFDLSPEQMEVVAAEVKARRKAYSVDNRVAAETKISRITQRIARTSAALSCTIPVSSSLTVPAPVTTATILTKDSSSRPLPDPLPLLQPKRPGATQLCGKIKGYNVKHKGLNQGTNKGMSNRKDHKELACKTTHGP